MPRAPASSSAPVEVTFDVREPETHLVRVTQVFPPAPGRTRTFRMPAWVPGSYKIRDFGRHVQDLSARVAGRPAKVRQPTKDAWTVEGSHERPVELSFAVYCRELTVDTSHVTADHAHLFPATMVMYDAASRHRPHRVRLQKPRGWSHWTGLETDALDGTLEVAADYDHLIDCPIECGPPGSYHVAAFQAAGRTHRHVVFNPPGNVDWRRIQRDMAKVCAQTVKVWGEAPYRHYTFLTHVAAEYGGGLEHRNSTVLGADPAHLQNDEKVQTRFLPLVAHEFFHTWNVKRILPAAFQPYDLQQEVYTDLLWLFEGFTSYYEIPILARAGVVREDPWSTMVGEFLEMYHKAGGRRRISVSQASRLTWTLLYQPHEHNVNRNVSYYTKGMWVGLCLDAELRRRGVRDGLDTVMRHVWRKHGRTGVGMTDDAFPDLVEQATGHDLRALLRAWTHGTAELPLERALRQMGWDLKQDWKDAKKNKGLGLEFRPGSHTIARIWEDMPAWRVLQPDDEIVAAAGYRYKQDHFHDQVANHKPGQPVEVAVFREGRLRTFQVPIVELPKDKFALMRRKGPEAKKARAAWLGGELATKPKDRKGRGPKPKVQ